MKCPLCGKAPIQTEHGLRKHLMGTLSYGGHELSDAKADDYVAVAAGRRALRDLPDGAPAPAARTPAPPAAVVAAPTLPPAPSVLPPSHGRPFLDSVLSTLTTFKALPKYQFERRIDAFLSVFLPEILARHLGGEIVLVAPEFPIKKATSNQSTNVDYILYRRGASPTDDRWLFFELKTDSGSVRDEQLGAYQAARQRGMRALQNELLAIRAATTETAKYDALLARLQGYSVHAPIEIVVLAPVRVPHAAVHSVTFRDLLDLELSGHAAEWALFKDLVIRPALLG